MMKIDPDRIGRILLIRLSALGDCLAAIPVFMALRKRFPQAHLAWAVQDNFAPLIENLPGLDELIIFPRQHWRRTPVIPKIKEAARLARHLRLRRFHAVVDVQSNMKSASLAFLSRAPIRIGHGREEAKELSSWLNNVLVSPLPEMSHIVRRNLHLLSVLGVESCEPEFLLPPDPLSERRVRHWLRERDIAEGNYFLITPFCGHPAKEWPPRYFTQLAEAIVQVGGKVVFLCGPSLEKRTLALIPSSCAGSVFLGPRTSIPEMVELIRFSRLTIGGDTGPVQIAGALGVATLALFGPTSPERSHPWGDARVVRLEANPSAVLKKIEDCI
ncbi:MAG: glycosyltransferase family 9 protein [Candidatus Omnitrophota bacterium]